MYDLANHLEKPERMLWTDMQLGPAGSPRPDVFTMAKSFAHPRPMTYEIKISITDFRSDITSGKWQKYLDFSSGVYFACPAGMITKADIPKGCGLILRSEKGWHTAKAPTLQAVKLPQDTMMKLLIDGIERHTPERRGAFFQSFIDRKIASQILGQDVANAVRDLQGVRSRQLLIQSDIDRRLDVAKAQVEKRLSVADDVEKKCMQEVVAARAELAEILGVSDIKNRYQMTDAIDNLKSQLSKDDQITAIRRFIESTEASLNRAKKLII